MIETDKRKAVFLLHQEGTQVREIARLLSLSRNTVRAIIRQGGAPPPPRPRANKLPLDEELLRRLYQECQGWIARMHEKLVEEEGVAVSYSTLRRQPGSRASASRPKPVASACPMSPAPRCSTTPALTPFRWQAGPSSSSPA